MADTGSGLVGLAIFVLIVAVGVVVGITFNDYLQNWIDGSSASK